jgi:hypothetical protein
VPRLVLVALALVVLAVVALLASPALHHTSASSFGHHQQAGTIWNLVNPLG